MPVPVHVAEEGYEPRRPHPEDLTTGITQSRFLRFARAVGWKPAVNVYEDDRGYYICAEIAGRSKDQIDVEVLGQQVVIRGDRPVPTPPQGRGPRCVMRMEINSGPFERRIELSEKADMNTVRARLTNGMLWISVTKGVP